MIDLTQPPFNAIGDGLSDCTSAFLNAAKSNTEIVLPPGGYRVSPCLFRDINNVKIRGAGGYASRILLASPGIALRFSNCQNVTLEDIAVQPLGDLPASSGVQFDEASGVGVVTRSKLTGFKQSGLRLIGTLAAPLSGFEIEDNLFLGNEGEQLYSKYSNDFWIEDNQFGILAGGNHPQYGAYLDHSGAGTYEGNYHWNNVNALKAVDSDFNNIIVNRFEMSDHEGVILDGCDYLTFETNTLHTNGLAAINTYDSLVATGLTNSTIAENKTFDWSGGTSAHRYSMNFGAGCALNTIGQNRAQGFGTGPFVSSVAAGQFDVDEIISGVSGGSIAAGTTAYLGTAKNSATEPDMHIVIGCRRAVYRLYAACVAAPGAVQTFTYTLRKNGTDTPVTATISGNASWSGIDASHPILLAADDQIDLKLATSAGAAVTQHRWKLDLVAY